MGLFIKNHSNYEKQPVAQQQQSAAFINNSDYVSYGINTGINSIFGLLTNFSDGKGGNANVGSEYSEKSIKSMEKDLNKVLSNLGLTSVSELDEYYKNKEIECNDELCEMYEKYIEIYDKSTDYFSLQIKDLEAKKAKTTDKSEIDNINMQITYFEQKKQEAKAKAEKIYNDTKVETQKELQTVKLEVEFAKSMAKKIDVLKNSSNYSDTESADINEQVGDYVSFNEARLDFLKKPSQKNLDKLKKAYNEFDNLSDNKSVTQAYNLLKNKYQTVEHNGKNVVLDWS